MMSWTCSSIAEINLLVGMVSLSSDEGISSLDPSILSPSDSPDCSAHCQPPDAVSESTVETSFLPSGTAEDSQAQEDITDTRNSSVDETDNQHLQIEDWSPRASFKKRSVPLSEKAAADLVLEAKQCAIDHTSSLPALHEQPNFEGQLEPDFKSQCIQACANGTVIESRLHALARILESDVICELLALIRTVERQNSLLDATPPQFVLTLESVRAISKRFEDALALTVDDDSLSDPSGPISSELLPLSAGTANIELPRFPSQNRMDPPPVNFLPPSPLYSPSVVAPQSLARASVGQLSIPKVLQISRDPEKLRDQLKSDVNFDEKYSKSGSAYVGKMPAQAPIQVASYYDHTYTNHKPRMTSLQSHRSTGEAGDEGPRRDGVSNKRSLVEQGAPEVPPNPAPGSDQTFVEKTVNERLQPTLRAAEMKLAMEKRKARVSNIAINFAIALQILFGTLVTIIAAVTNGTDTRIVISVFGGLSTLTALYLARCRGVGQPEASVSLCKYLENFIRDLESYLLDHGHERDPQYDLKIANFRRRFEKLL